MDNRTYSLAEIKSLYNHWTRDKEADVDIYCKIHFDKWLDEIHSNTDDGVDDSEPIDLYKMFTNNTDKKF